MHTNARPICLLLGADGQLGVSLCKILTTDFDVRAFNKVACDLTDADAIRNCIKTNQPNVIVNAAAYTAVDRAEAEYSLAFAVNAEALRIIAQEAKVISAAVLHFSTDYVFGSSTSPRVDSALFSLGSTSNLYYHSESDIPAPLNVYGKSKLAGERNLVDILGTDYPWWVVRSSWIFSAHGNNFLNTILKLGASRAELSVVSDQIGVPTSTTFIAEVSVRILEQRPPSGIYHLSSSGATNWYDYACYVIRAAREKNIPIMLHEKNIVALASEEYPCAAERPRNSLLDCTKITNALAMQCPDWRAEVDAVIDEIAIKEFA